MNDLQIFENAKPRTLESREVAEMVGKEHSKLLRDIRTYSEQLAEAKIGHSDFFRESTYQDANNQSRPCYLVTRKGCEFIANKLTGQKGTEFTAKYINRFHDMENGILDSLSPELKAIIAHDVKLQSIEKKVNSVDEELQEFKMDMPFLAVECDKVTSAVKSRGVKCLGGKDSNAYHDKSLRGKVYSDIHRELKRQFGVTTYKAIKRNQCDAVISIVDNYELPIVLAKEIRVCNAQIHDEAI